jgi:hypothetical protein
MPLVRGQDTVFETVKGIHFLMRDPNTREYIACLITHEALIYRGTPHEPSLAPMQVFDIYRSEIERAASDRWDHGEVDGHHIIHISTAQFQQKPVSEAEPIDVTLVPRPGGGPKDGDNGPSTRPASGSSAAQKPSV